MDSKMPGANGHLRDDIRLDQITYISAHNCAQSKAYGWLYCQQNVTITEQFENWGARHFKIPIHWFQDGNSEPKIVCAHEGDGKANCKLTRVQRALKSPELAETRLQEISQLIQRYPREIVFLKFESYLHSNSDSNGTLGWSDEDIANKFHQLMLKLDFPNRAIVWKENQAPTLGECRAANKNLIILVDQWKMLINEIQTYAMQTFQVQAQIDWENNPLDPMPGFPIKRGIYFTDGSGIWNPFLEIHFNPENSLKADSEYKYKYNCIGLLEDRFNQAIQKLKKRPNFLAADFIDQGNLQQFVDDLNSQL